MNWKNFTLKILFVFALISIINLAVSDDSKSPDERRAEVVPYADNNGYWIKMAELGLATLNPDDIKVEPATYTGSRIKSTLSITEDSPDVPVTTETSTQSENSIFINPEDNTNPLNSNNSTGIPASNLYGANDLYSFDAGETWEGEIQGAGGSNSGDPTTAINRNGRWFVGFISSGSGQGVAYSDDEGETWTQVTVAGPQGASLLDKNHMWIDNSPDSPYEGNLYDAWTPLGGSNPNNDEITLSYSADAGESWSSPVSISNAVNAGSHNQGVNLSSGPNGEAYAIWAIYDSWPSDENAIGFAKSLDGGETWEPATRIITNIRGIRTSETSKNMRVNSFPVMDVDISAGDHRGDIYVTWANIGVPGTNTGNDIDVYMIKSEDDGETWSEPFRVNQDPAGEGSEHYFPWVTVDPVSGSISVVYYDDRNVGGNQLEVFCSNSLDGGETWEDMKVSDVSFTPSPIPGLAGGYFGDYLGIAARGGTVYPVWTDNRSGNAMTYVSPYQLIVVADPFNLQADVDQQSGEVELSWQMLGGVGFEHFNIYRDDLLIGTSTSKNFTDQLEDYGYYNYKVEAVFIGNNISNPAYTTAQWGEAQIAATPLSISDTVLRGNMSSKTFMLKDTGQLPLEYTISLKNNTGRDILDYCEASGGCGGFISRVQFGEIDNETECDAYADYTDQVHQLRIGDSAQITVTKGGTGSNYKLGIWIDWNQNEDFTDDQPVSVDGSPGSGPFTATIVAPIEALEGTTRMRIRTTSLFGALEPCGTETSGEVEDYAVDVVKWIDIDPLAGTIEAGDSTEHTITVDGLKIPAGDYAYSIFINSNDPDQARYEIAYELSVIPMLVNASADPTAICSGNSAQVFVEVEGGSGSYNYTWTSDPPGYNSNEQNPVFENITETTTFMVEVDDGEYQVNGETSVTVYPDPEVDLGADQSLCQGEDFTFDATGDFETYQWNTGSTDPQITVSESGTYWVEVSNEYGCSGSDTVELIVNELPVVALGPDTAICQDEVYLLDAGNDGASYYWSTGETSQTIQVDTNNYDFGVYEFWVEVTSENDCISYDTVVVELENCAFGMDEVFAGTRISIYPNPNDGKFSLGIQSPGRQVLNLSIISARGKMIYSRQNVDFDAKQRETINLDQATPGVYMLMIEKDGYYKMKKMIVR